MTTLAIVVVTVVAFIAWLFRDGRASGADQSALASAERDAKAARAETKNVLETMQGVEDATLGITDRDTALASLRASHPAPKP